MGLLRFVIISFCCIAHDPVLAQGSVAPAISLASSGGQNHTFSDFSGRPAVIHFWATWCSACLAELPQLIDAIPGIESLDVSVIFIAADSMKATRAYLQAQKLEIDVLVDQYGKAMRDCHVKALPTSLFIDASGHIIETRQGRIDWSSAETISMLNRLRNH